MKLEEWGWYATGPVHSIQMQNGPHRGRLVVPANHRLSDDGVDRGPNGAQVVISEDHGKTWRLGAIDATYDDGLNANETTVVELNNGTLYFNTRDQNGDAEGTRGETLSHDGGDTFSPTDSDWKEYAPAPAILDAPVVQCALLRAREDLILFSGPDNNGPNGKGRSDLRIRFSKDEAKTWKDGPLLHVGPAAYSDMTLTSDGNVGVLFEASDPGHKNAYQRVVFVLVDPAEIE
ncbi:MAG: sialidase family protein [Verrucomicrobiota bacterium]